VCPGALVAGLDWPVDLEDVIVTRGAEAAAIENESRTITTPADHPVCVRALATIKFQNDIWEVMRNMDLKPWASANATLPLKNRNGTNNHTRNARY
jgi:hypothetical protein